MERSASINEERYFVKKSAISALTVITTLATLHILAPAVQASEEVQSETLASTSSASARLWDNDNKLSVPSILSNKDKKKFEKIFTAIESQQWDDAKKAIEKAPKSPLRYMAQAELYLAAGSPRIDRDDLLSLINNAPYLPQAEQLGRLATRRGAEKLPSLPGRKKLLYSGSSPSRHLPRPVAETGSET